tara:strand:- start:227 stop:685 length:459 start_codon:yes stop_codon:yes gene_type:complete
MKNKKIILLIFFILLNQCGYNSIYNNSSDLNIKIGILSMSGDREFNNKIFNQIRRFNKKESSKEFNINLNTNINKDIVSKDTTGKVIDYVLKATATFKITYNDINETITFEESLYIKNIDDSFEQKKYEDVIKDNFASSIYQKLIFKLKKIE